MEPRIQYAQTKDGPRTAVDWVREVAACLRRPAEAPQKGRQV